MKDEKRGLIMGMPRAEFLAMLERERKKHGGEKSIYDWGSDAVETPYWMKGKEDVLGAGEKGADGEINKSSAVRQLSSAAAGGVSPAIGAAAAAAPVAAGVMAGARAAGNAINSRAETARWFEDNAGLVYEYYQSGEADHSLEGEQLRQAVIDWAKESRKSKKERSTDVPKWSKHYPKSDGEDGNARANRLMEEKYGPGWRNRRTAHEEHSEIKKEGNRNK